MARVDVITRASGREVWLTFDDGPTPSLTEQILEILAAESVKAIFFVCGVQVEACPGLVARLSNEGHEVGNHSWSHRRLNELDTADVHTDLVKTNCAITRVTGRRCRLFRPPYGMMNPAVLQVSRELGLKSVLWSLTPEDWECPGEDAITSRVLSVLKPGDVVLLHDGCGDLLAGQPGVGFALSADRTQTVRSLPRIIQGARRLGLEFPNREAGHARLTG